MARSVVIVTEDPVGEALGGAAIRAYELARCLTDIADVTLAAPGTEPPDLGPVRHVAFEAGDRRPLRALFREADVVITRPLSPLEAGWLHATKARVVYDLLDPLPLDILEAQGSSSRERQLLWQMIALDQFLAALHSGHYFICGGRRQRDLYLGALLGSRLISPAAYHADPSFRTFIDRVPFGIPSRAPQRLPEVGARRQLDGIGEDAQIVLWNGGIWNWLDPVTAVAGAVRAAERNPRVRLVFMFKPPAPGPQSREADAARDLAQRLGALDRIVFFNNRVVTYRERPTWLLDSDCVLSTNQDHLEANFAYRTRLLDCFWAGLPAVCTRGDELSEMLEAAGGGAMVPHGDADAVADGIIEVLARGRDAYRKRLVAAGQELVWERVVEPLRRFVASDAPPRALGDPLARALSQPVRRARAAAIRTARSLRPKG
jgi:glycosyltransferase involved in cell wall biosynthesis